MSLELHPLRNMIFSKDAPDSTKSIAAPTLNEWPESRASWSDREVLASNRFNIMQTEPRLSFGPTLPCRQSDPQSYPHQKITKRTQRPVTGLGGDKRFYRNLSGRVCPLHNYHDYRCDLEQVFPALASFLIALLTALLDTIPP